MLLGLALVLLLPQVARAGGAVVPSSSSHETAEAVRWGFVIALAAELIVGYLLKKDVLKVIVGADNRISTSKTIAATWTFIVGAALLALVYADLLNHPDALEATNTGGRVGQYALLFGGPLGAAILSKAIVVNQVNEAPNAKTTAPSPQLSDLIANDEKETDLGDLQYVLFNAVALVFVLGTMLIHEPAGGLPHIPDVLLGLTSVAAAGYVGKKLLPPPKITAEMNPTSAARNAEVTVTITLTGVPQPAQGGAYFWVRFGGENEVKPARAAVSKAGVAQLQLKPPLAALPPTVPVTVITEAGAVVEVGDFTIE